MAQKGRLFLVKTGSPLASILSSRSVDMTINGEAVDVTTKGSAPFRKLLEDAGITSVTVNLEGVYESDEAGAVFNTRALSRSIDAYEIVSEDGETWSGDFQLTNFSVSGTYNGEQAYSVTLESSDEVEYDDGESGSGV